MSLALLCKILTYCSCEKQDHDHSCRDPEGAVEIWVTLHNVEEVLARVERAAASVEDLIRIDIEELLVEGDAPEEAFRGGRRLARGVQEGALLGVGGDLVSRIVIVECFK